MIAETASAIVESPARTGLWGAPIFDFAWWRRRSLWLSAACLLIFGALSVAISLEVSDPARGARVLVADALFWLVVLALGPAIAVRIRRRCWPFATEAFALVFAVLLPIAGATVLKPHWEGWAEAAIPATSKQPVLLSLNFRFGAHVEDAPHAPANEGAETGAKEIRGIVPFDALLAFFIGGGLALFRYFPQQRRLADAQRRRELAAAQSARREAELKLSVLAAQVEPHFLFNTLAGVRGAVASDPARAMTLIDRLSDYLRLTIPRLRADAQVENATLAQQLDIVEAYLGLTHARLPRLAYRIDRPPDLAAARFPPLMLISLVENAVKHGIEPKPGPASIEVTARRDGDRLTVSVCDDGMGFGAGGGGSGLGLVNIRERLAQLYGGAAALELTARAGGGVCAAISLPFEPHATDADRPAG